MKALKHLFSLVSFAFIALISIQCQSNGQNPTLSQPTSGKEFNAYWYQGKAELTSYELQQARYGELHQGHAVLIYVTEDFSKSKQVKLDNPAKAGKDAVKVMKLNATKKFITGIYPYSLMTSVYTPVNGKSHPRTLKVNTSVQDWCGHTFSQLNSTDQGYTAILHSYFESEGEQQVNLSVAIPEEALWTRFRINPESLPQGSFTVIPAQMTQRLRHTPLQTEKAIGKLTPMTAAPEWLPDTKPLYQYSVDFSESDRTLNLYFTQAFPYQLVGWDESYIDGWGANAKRLITKAIQKKTIMIDYWNLHKVSDSTYRQKLGLK